VEEAEAEAAEETTTRTDAEGLQPVRSCHCRLTEFVRPIRSAPSRPETDKVVAGTGTANFLRHVRGTMSRSRH
jgi:hypothetical protein